MKKGSALLIVLGMVAFMFVSAVGFSIYMRTSRVPSSYVRRNIAARHLVKAALAKAIGELEGDFNTDDSWGSWNGGSETPRRFYGIHDDPFPGILHGADATENQAGNNNYNGDCWLGRVFTPFGWVKDESETVSTLTLEALAYLPPALIDDVRRLSRFTRTAIWRPLPYGTGRYAYCAVNVSDLFDINRLRADEPRDSGQNRVTLAPLCTKADGSIDTGAASELDAVLDKADPVPFVSLADFNIVAGSGSPWAPFMSAVGGDSGRMLTDNDPRHANELFITDTWFPTSTNEESSTTLDLASGAQPFKSYTATCFMDIGSTAKGVLNTESVNGVNIGELYVKNLGIGIVCLYDYLDSNDKPSSLALPTTEAVPMVVGVSCPGAPGLEPTVETLDEQTATIEGIKGTVYGMFTGDDGSQVKKEKEVSSITATRKCTTIGLKSLGTSARVKVVVVNPFKRLNATQRNRSCKIQGLMRVWLAEEGMGCRPSDDSILYPAKQLWDKAKDSPRGVVENGVATFFAAETGLPNFGDVKTSGEAVSDNAELVFELDDVNMPLYYKVEEFDPKPSQADINDGYDTVEISSIENKTYKEKYCSFGKLADNTRTVRPLKSDGGVSEKWAKENDDNNFDISKPYDPDRKKAGVPECDMASLPRYRLYAAVWVQVKDDDAGDFNVVDMVPACLKDDPEWLGANRTVLVDPAENVAGGGAPLLNFRCRVPVSYSDVETTLPQSKSSDMEWKALYAGDPRFNFAPEDWFSSSAGNAATANEWKQAVGVEGSSAILGRNGRDPDIFMFVSDQEYLQSIGELQFLPFLEDMDGTRLVFGDYAPDFHGRSLAERTGPLDGVNAVRYWKTYTAYPVGGIAGTGGRNPYYMQYGGNDVNVVSGAAGFKVNPFSQDNRVIDAAIKGTPFDWYVASTNYNQTQGGGRKNNIIQNMTLDDMVDKYSFSKDNALAKITEENLDDIADAIKDRIETRARDGDTDWLAAFESLQWQSQETTEVNDDNKTFMGNLMDNVLHGVDRKYLHSFWRECFDNRQQLFLIFVRAEPASVGGGGLGRMPSQLGGRAVALVWRDPKPPASDTSRPRRSEFNDFQKFLDLRGSKDHPPHRTRVLFYHQFD